MAFDRDVHIIDPATGFATDARTGAILGVQQSPVAAPVAGSDFPKWVTVHDDRVKVKRAHGAPPHVWVDGFADFHVARDGVVTVLVEDAEGEALAATDAANATDATDAADAADAANATNATDA